MSESATTPIKKTAAKKDAGSETARRVRPVALKGWSEIQAQAYGSVPGSKSLELNPIAPLAVKKKIERDDGMTVQVTKPINVVVTGTPRVEDEKVFVVLDPEYVTAHRAAEEAFVEAGCELLNCDGKMPVANYFGDNMLRLKTKHFNGRFVSKFEAGTRTDKLEAADAISGEKVQLILRYYGLYTTEDCYGPLVSVAAFNMLSNQ